MQTKSQLFWFAFGSLFMSCSVGMSPYATEPSLLSSMDTGEHTEDATQTDSGGGDGREHTEDSNQTGTDSGDASTNYRDPFEERPDTSEGLVNTSINLEEVLEFGALEGACDAWRADPEDRRMKLMCGKWMFFYEGFSTLGIPAPLINWIARNFPDADEAGLAFTNYGLIQDPYRSTPDQPVHLGVGEGAPMGSTDTLALTCANCHFGQMPDGRYSVGYPNLEYEYGTHMLAMFITPMKGIPGFDVTDYPPEAIAAIQPLLDRFDEDPFLGLGMAINLLPMLAGGIGEIPTISFEDQAHYAKWKPGTMDFTIAPLPIEDGIHTVSRILPLWGLPTADEQALYGMDNALLAWTGSARSLDEFLSGFVTIGGGPIEDWGPDQLAPLREYIESLAAPVPLEVEEADVIEAGRTLFREAGCKDCHAGPAGSGLEVFSFDEIGTDDAMAWWGDGDRDGEMCCGIEGELTGGIKAPRLRGLHALTRFLHNGSVNSLEELLCLDERPPSAPSPFANIGHDYGCSLIESQRIELLAFLKSI